MAIAKQVSRFSDVIDPAPPCLFEIVFDALEELEACGVAPVLSELRDRIAASSGPARTGP